MDLCSGPLLRVRQLSLCLHFVLHGNGKARRRFVPAHDRRAARRSRALLRSSAFASMQERCSRDQIVNLLQEKHAAYDAHGVHSLLARKYDAVEEQLEAANAAPSTFVSSLWLMVQPALSTAAEEDEPLPPQEPPNSGSSCEPPPKPSVGKQVSLGSFFGKGSVIHYSKLPDGTRVIDRVIK